MFDQLPESRPRRPRRTGHAVVSIVAHTILIVMSIRLTSAAATELVRRTAAADIVFRQPPAERVRPDPTPARAQSLAREPAVPAMPMLPPTANLATDVPALHRPPRFDPRSLDAVPPTGYRDLPGPGGDSTGRVPGSALDVDEPARYLDGPSPQYPAAMRHVGIDGWVQLRYVVGIDGRAEPASIVVITSSGRSFEEPARTAIEGSRFRAARLAGHEVRQLVEQVVRFTIR